MAEKRYYWIQLREGFFTQKEIKKLRKIAGGDTYTVIYLKMLLAAVKQGNKLFFEGVEDTFPEELALELDEDPENVKVTLSFLERQGLIKVMGEDEFLLLQCEEMVGSESESAARVRRYREKKTLQCNSDVTPLLRDGNTDIDIEKDIKKEINIKKAICSEPNSEPEADVAAIVLNDRSEWRPTEALFAEYVRLYPNVDVKQQFNEMRGWCLSNPSKRKTRRGVTRFVNSWLAREQDKGGNGSRSVSGSPKGLAGGAAGERPNSFHNFEQRSTDYDAIVLQMTRERLGIADKPLGEGE